MGSRLWGFESPLSHSKSNTEDAARTRGRRFSFQEVDVIRRTPARILALLALLVLAACSSDADRIAEAGLERIEQVNAILEQHKGNDDAALKALTDFEFEHRQEVADFRRKGIEVVGALSSQERDKHTAKWGPKVMEQRARTETLLRTFTAPKDLIKVIGRIVN